MDELENTEPEVQTSLWLDQSLVVNADTVYSNTVGGEQKLVGRDVEVTLPEIKYEVLETTAMGKYELAQIHKFEPMEMTIKHIGIDSGLAALCMAEMLEIEIRWVEQVMIEDKSIITVGCKAFINAHPQVATPKIKVKNGQGIDMSIPYHVNGYKLVRDGVVLWDINRLSQKFIVNNVDYYAHLESMI